MADQEWPQEVLNAAEQAVRERPGSTSAEVAMRVRSILLAAGTAPPLLPRDKAKALLRMLEAQGKITRRTSQALVTFYPAEQTVS